MASANDELAKPAGQMSEHAKRGYNILAFCAGLLAIAISLSFNTSRSNFSDLRGISATLARALEFVNSPVVLFLIAAALFIAVLKGKLLRWKLVAAGYLIGGALASSVLKIVRH